MTSSAGGGEILYRTLHQPRKVGFLADTMQQIFRLAILIDDTLLITPLVRTVSSRLIPSEQRYTF